MTFLFPACELCLKYDREHLRHILATHPPPRPWKPRHNDRLRLLCDASAFLNAPSHASTNPPPRSGCFLKPLLDPPFATRRRMQ